MSVSLIDIPFEHIHKCWFCGEPKNDTVTVKKGGDNYDFDSFIAIPSCPDCETLAKKSRLDDLEGLQQYIKTALVKTYATELSIGLNWTEKELSESDFNGSSLEGFRKSAWQVYQMAKERVNFKGWALTIDSLELDYVEYDHVTFEGVQYSTLDRLIEHISNNYYIEAGFLRKVIEVMGKNKITQAVKFCRLLVADSEHNKQQALADLIEEKQEQSLTKIKCSIPNRRYRVEIEGIEEDVIQKTTVPVDVIHWAMEYGIKSIEELDKNEEFFFTFFDDDNSDITFRLFNALEIYLDKKTYSPTWFENKDPNYFLWLELDENDM